VEALILEKDGVMPRQGKYPDEVRERAVGMVLDHEHEYGSQWEAICSVAEKLGPKAETVRLWVRRAEANEGRRPGPTTGDLAELKRLKRENAELRRANDMAGSGGGRNDLCVGL
jgi:transposase